MNLAADERARVPFALVGVLLLVSSGAYVTALGAGSDARTSVPTATAAADAQSVTRSVLARAARGAARDAARRPLVTTANTSAGRAVAAADGSAFRAALELRIAVAARAALAGTEARTGAVAANVTLRGRNASRLLRAVTVTPRAGGDAMTVRFENLSLTVARDGRRVTTRSYAPTVVVHVPLLALHDRVENFTADLGGNYLDAGFPRRLTTRLHAVAWARGYAQYGGAPISNVLANRHVALAANGALLQSQRAAFGAADPDARRSLGSAAARTGLRDLFGGVGTRATNSLPAEYAGTADTATDAVERSARNLTPGTEPVVAGVNRSADRALLDLLDGRANAILDEVFSADARRLVRVSPNGTTNETPARPAGATLQEVERSRSVRIERANATLPAAPASFETLATRERAVTVVERTRWRWQRGDETLTTHGVSRERYRVGVRLAVRRGETKHAPSRPLRDESAYDGVPALARERLLSNLTGALRAAATTGAPAARANVTLDVERPAGVRKRAVTRLADTHERAANVSVRLPPSAAVDGNPAAALAAAFERFRANETAPPATYPDPEAKATLALRRAYADAVADRLAERAERAAPAEKGVSDALGGALPENVSVSELLAPAPATANDSELSVSARPAYLSLSATDRTNGTYPLVARNTNLFTVPYGDAADGLVETVLDEEEREYGVSTAARTLAAANRTLRTEQNGTLAERRATLRTALAATVAETERDLESRLVVSGIERGAAETAVTEGTARWNTVHARALALANGSAASAVARAAADDRPASLSRAELVAELRVVLAERRTVSLPAGAVNRTVGAARSVVRASATKTVERGLQRGAEAAVERLPKRLRSAVAAAPAGLPVSPVPGYWYATVNAWDVALRGGYRNFSVRAPTGSPTGNLTYVRTNASVSLDVDGDGEAERIGSNRAPTFETRTGVIVVVPPGGRGVGDGANADERSAGWGRRG